MSKRTNPPRITQAELRALRACVAQHVALYSSEGARRLQAVARRALDKLSGAKRKVKP